MRLGVFGGSFDPVHIGHLIVAESAADLLGLSKVLFVPARAQPFKAGQHAATAEHRAAMLRLAIEGNPRFSLDRREIEREGPSYSVDTLRALRFEFPEDELSLLVGADAAWDLPHWHEAAVLPRYASIVVLSRPGYEPPQIDMISKAVDVPEVNISASSVRRLAESGRSLRYLLPAAVVEYIESHDLYGSTEKC